MEEKFVLNEVMSEDAIGDIAFESRTARIKGFIAGASLVGVGWLATGLYKKIKARKSKEVDESKEDLVD